MQLTERKSACQNRNLLSGLTCLVLDQSVYKQSTLNGIKYTANFSIFLFMKFTSSTVTTSGYVIEVAKTNQTGNPNLWNFFSMFRK